MHFQPGETNIICRDAKASLRFYRDVLGFTLVEKENGAVRLSAAGRTYLLLPFATEPRTEHSYCATPEFSLDLYVENLEEAYAYLKEHDVQFIREWEKGKPSCIIRDPDGLVIEVIQA